MEYKQISTEYLRRNLPEIQGRASFIGDHFEVTNHGRTVFRILPPATHPACRPVGSQPPEDSADGERLARPGPDPDPQDFGYHLTGDDEGGPLFSDDELRRIGTTEAALELLRRGADITCEGCGGPLPIHSPFCPRELGKLAKAMADGKVGPDGESTDGEA